jgi:hypothetical protein
MKSLRTHLPSPASSIWLLPVVIFFGFSGCDHKEQPENYIARVNDTYLFEEDLAAAAEQNESDNREREELIREWVRDELLFQEAEESGILKSQRYLHLINEAKRRIAGSLLLQSYFDENTISYSDEDLENFFRTNKESFRLPHNAFYINMVILSEEEKAIAFRNMVLDAGWKSAVDQFTGDSALVYNGENLLEYEFSLPSAEMLRVLQLLRDSETSYILHPDIDKFVVVQLLGKYSEQEIPPMEALREQIINNFNAFRREELLKDFYDRLYSENIVEISR